MRHRSPFNYAVLMTLFLNGLAWSAEPWLEPMKAVHAKFKGQPGTLAHFGDSITVTMAYWAPLEGTVKNLPEEGQKALATVRAHMKKEAWRQKGPQFGSEGGMTIEWAHKNIDAWLKKMNPEAAVIMFGTNDIGGVKLDVYETKYRDVVAKCLENGTIPIVTTIPPRHAAVEKSKAYADVVRKLAKEMNLLLIDYHAEILKRSPDGWNGAEKFKGAKDVYNVEALISADGVHPSAPKKFANDFSEEALAAHGYNLRSYLTLLGYTRVINEVIKK